MQIGNIGGSLFAAYLLPQGAATGLAGRIPAAGNAGQDFRANLAVRLAEVRNLAVELLLSLDGGSTGAQAASGMEAAFGSGAAADRMAGMAGSSAVAAVGNGRNPALFDPESAYRMMTGINASEAGYKAEYAEMGEMKIALGAMRDAGAKLAAVGEAPADADLRTGLHTFAAAYNAWTDRFDEDLATGGVLAATQAAQVSQRELAGSVADTFTGAANGFRGIRELGLSIDPATGFVRVDDARLDAALAANRTAAVATLREFGAGFARSAELLASEGNFVANRLERLDDVIDYLEANKASLQAEFGLGDPARPAGTVAQGLERYKAMQNLAG